jgi:hypothetical protein
MQPPTPPYVVIDVNEDVHQLFLVKQRTQIFAIVRIVMDPLER